MHARRLLPVALLLVFAAAAPDAHAAKARTFWITGASGSITVGETSERLSRTSEDQRDRFRAEAEMSWDFVPPRRRIYGWPTIAVPFRAREGSTNGYSEAGLDVRATIEIRASGETWVGDRHEPWSCTLRRTLKRNLPVEVSALGGPRFEIGALPASGFTAPTSARACTAADPAALPEVVSFGGAAMRSALTLTHGFTTRELKSRRLSLELVQPGGEAGLDCVSEAMPVCTQTAQGSMALKLSKACRDGKAVVVDDSMSCDHAYPDPRRRG